MHHKGEDRVQLREDVAEVKLCSILWMLHRLSGEVKLLLK
jgi:hypothetical protein